jgi:hypothetical protein
LCAGPAVAPIPAMLAMDAPIPAPPMAPVSAFSSALVENVVASQNCPTPCPMFRRFVPALTPCAIVFVVPVNWEALNIPWLVKFCHIA